MKDLGEKRAKNKKLVYGLVIIVSSIILTFSLCLAFSPIVTSQESNKLSTSPISTDDEAIRIAVPIVERYAEENNRTITTVEAMLRDSSQPYWFVEAVLEPIDGRGYHERSVAYQVSIMADNGELWHHGPIWNNAWQNSSIWTMDKNIINVDKAIEIAIPIAEDYAKENNRTITTMVEASLSNYADSRPSWQIDIKFEPVDELGVQHWIDAYQVSVWGDTGEIQSHNERGWYS